MRPGERQEGRHDALSAVPDGSGPTAASEPVVADVTETTEFADTPEIPEAVRAAARRAPGHWIGVVDPEWTEDRTPPEWAVLGEWQSDEDGGVGDYRANPAYRPSARVLGWPEPSDPVDAAAQRAATGYGSVDEALAALAEAEITVVRGPDGGPLTATGLDGAPVVLLFTSPVHEFMSAALRHDTLPARELARSLSASGTRLLANAGAAAPLLVPADSLLDPVRVPGAEGAPAAEAVTVESSGGISGSADRTGPAAAARTDSSPEPWPHTTGRTT
ncbi:type VII secretion system-associated protein [Streptomyces sp. NBC_01481]|uniref:type VII secretion system-associated protein n=1 Tax=Streptomyces sp. NBC_01481 TaxID=2975869 RepID=UPI00225A1D7B|nr:type VII secretion system-associated protein [Streptomyces sp. NBC_01481]MCX4586397.1 type VII secretion system-associated protein [Streptomyces sp. NBC_01481]